MGARRKKGRRTRPTYSEERRLLREGFAPVAGLDEVGRGCLAGPVVAGAAILPRNPRGGWVSETRDSKQMTARQRERVLVELQARAPALATGAATAAEIDRIGIVPATRLAMQRAIAALAAAPAFLLIDAIELPNVPLPQKPIVRGDATCLSIAAASIVAKVARDRMMESEDAAYPPYGFATNKGYGTRHHLRALEERGPCPIHRRSFAPVRQPALL